MTTLYGIKNCDTVKKARKWLDENNIEYTFHDFRIDGLDEEKVKTWLATSGLSVLLNKRSTTFRQLDDSTKNNLDETTAVQLFIEQPTLIKRPVLEVDNLTQVGFKVEEYQKRFN